MMSIFSKSIKSGASLSPHFSWVLNTEHSAFVEGKMKKTTLTQNKQQADGLDIKKIT